MIKNVAFLISAPKNIFWLVGAPQPRKGWEPLLYRQLQQLFLSEYFANEQTNTV